MLKQRAAAGKKASQKRNKRPAAAAAAGAADHGGSNGQQQEQLPDASFTTAAQEGSTQCSTLVSAPVVHVHLSWRQPPNI
jgi:hypothetical protein